MTELDREFYRKLRFLVIDDQAAARQSLRTCAQTMGAFSVDFSASYQDAIGRVKRTQPDVILCDYNLGDGRSGQLLLEELRRTDALPDETVFIMVTAEKSYEHVVAAVELGPDDYIIKPFSPDRLKFRLDRALKRRHFFEPLYRAKRERDFERGEAFVAEHRESEAGQPYRFELMRQSAELQLLKGDTAAAQAAYEAILALHPFPWAKAGMARVFLQQNRLQEARETVDAVVDGAPMYFDAFDLKTRICMEMGDYAEAQRTVEETSRRTTRNYTRKRLLADAAMRNGDAEVARAAMADVIQNDVTPGAVSVEDHLMLVRSHLEAGEVLEAEEAIRKIRQQQLETASLDEKASYHALLAALDPERERAAFESRSAEWGNEWLGVATKVDLVRAALALGDHKLASAITNQLFSSDQIRHVFNQVRELFERAGLEQTFRDRQKQAALARIRAEGAARKVPAGDPEAGDPLEGRDAGSGD